MADFTSELQQPGGAGATPLSPVRAPDKVVPFVNAAENIGSIFVDYTKNKKREEDNNFYSSYTHEIEGVEQAVKGGMSLTQATVMKRDIASKYYNMARGNLELSKGLHNLINYREKGTNTTTEMEEYDRGKKMLDEYASVGGNTADKEGLERFIAAKSRAYETEQQLKEIQNSNATEKEKGIQRANVMSKTFMEEAHRSLPALNTLAVKMNDTLSKGGDILPLMKELAPIKEQAATLIADVSLLDPEKGRVLKEYYSGIMDTVDKLSDPKIGQEARKNLVEDFGNKVTLAAAAEGRMDVAIGMTRIGSNNPVLQFQTAKYLKENTNIGLNVVEGKPVLLNDENIGSTTKYVGSVTKNLEKKGEEDKEKAINVASNYLQSVANSPNLSTANVQEVIRYMGKPEFREVVPYLNDKAIAAVTKVFQGTYATAVTKAMGELNSQKIGGTPFASLVSPALVNGRFTFNYDDSSVPDDLKVTTYLMTRRIRNAEDAINDMIRAGANLENTTTDKYFKRLTDSGFLVKNGSTRRGKDGKLYKNVGAGRWELVKSSNKK